MFELVYFAIAILCVLLILSTFLIARKSIFKEQIRAKSVEAMWFTIQAEKEADIEKSISYFNAAQARKKEVEAMTKKSPVVVNYAFVPEESITPEETKSLSLGELLHYYDEKYNNAEVYKKFNQEG